MGREVELGVVRCKCMEFNGFALIIMCCDL